MIILKNPTNSPYDIQTKQGMKVLPAHGELECELDPAYLDILKLSFAVEVVDGKQKASKNPEPEQPNTEEDPAEKYERLTGKKPDGRWSDERLAAEIEKLEG